MDVKALDNYHDYGVQQLEPLLIRVLAFPCLSGNLL